MARKTVKEVAAVVSALGALLEIGIRLVELIRERGGDVAADIYRLATDEGRPSLAKIADIIVAEARQATEIVSKYWESVWDVAVDFSQDLGQMISAGGYDYAHPEITAEHFPVKGTGKTAAKVELLHFDRDFNNGDEVITELEAVNKWLAEQKAGYRYRFARIEELLSLGAKQHELQRKYPIAALGSIWPRPGGFRVFVCLGRDGRRRGLDLDGLEGGFCDGWRFAVVREQLIP